MPSSLTPGSSDIACVQFTRCRHGLRRDLNGSALPTLPQSVSRGARLSRLHWFAFATACQVARPPGRIGPSFPGPPGAFTSRLPAGRSPFPPLDMTTTATGLLCWRDFHPQEWQLASLHQTRTCRFPASGSSGESFAPGDVAMDDPGFVDHPSNDAVRDSPVEEAPQMAMVSATPGLALARLAIRCRFVDRFAGLRVPSRVSRQRFSAPDASLPSDGSR